MSDEDLSTYKLQLQQVEAALTTDPTNEELIQLKTDLEQVITLTAELISGGGDEEGAEEYVEEAQDAALDEALKQPEAKKKKSRWAAAETALPVKPWQVGETCQALYRGDGQYHDCKIHEINGDEVKVIFPGYAKPYNTTLSTLKMPSNGQTTVHTADPISAKSKKELEIKRREYLKEKKKKKQEKLKDMIDAKEKEKKGWQSFSGKAFGKKGFVKKSIFKTPESTDGKVGVGTCGVSGQGMTDWNRATKYKKNF